MIETTVRTLQHLGPDQAYVGKLLSIAFPHSDDDSRMTRSKEVDAALFEHICSLLKSLVAYRYEFSGFLLPPMVHDSRERTLFTPGALDCKDRQSRP